MLGNYQDEGKYTIVRKATFHEISTEITCYHKRLLPVLTPTPLKVAGEAAAPFPEPIQPFCSYVFLRTEPVATRCNHYNLRPNFVRLH